MSQRVGCAVNKRDHSDMSIFLKSHFEKFCCGIVSNPITLHKLSCMCCKSLKSHGNKVFQVNIVEMYGILPSAINVSQYFPKYIHS